MATKTKRKKSRASDILTLSEAADYLRVRESDVVRCIEEQGLPARQACARPSKGILSSLGVFKDDPHMEEIVSEAMRRRGRPTEKAD